MLACWARSCSSAVRTLCRIDQLAEGFLQRVDRAEMMAGVDQEVAQRLIVFADPGADIGERGLVVVRGAVGRPLIGRKRRGIRRQFGAGERKEVRHRTHDSPQGNSVNKC